MTKRLHPKRILVAIFLILLVTGLAAVTGFYLIQRLLLDLQAAQATKARASEGAIALLNEQEQILNRMRRGDMDADGSQDLGLALGRGLERLSEQLETLETGEADQGNPDTALSEAVGQEGRRYRTQLGSLVDALQQDRVPEAEALSDSLSANAALRRRLTALTLTYQEDVLQNQKAVRDTARGFTVLIVVCTSLGMMAALFFYYRLTRLFLQPVEVIADFLRKAGSGDLNRRLPHQETVDMERLAGACNRLLANVMRAIEENRRRSRAERLVASAVVESRKEPILAMAAGGDVVLANSEARDMLTSASGNSLTETIESCLDQGKDTLEYDGTVYRIDRLKVPGGIRFAGNIVALAKLGAAAPETADAVSKQQDSGGDHDEEALA